MKSIGDASYNERLFSRGFRGWLHSARFHWAADTIAKLDARSILEVGCHDGRVIDFLHRKPSLYKGFDANWEKGIDLAKVKWQGQSNYQFFVAGSADEMRLSEKFDVAISLETLEHVDDHLLDPYLAKVAEHLNGHFLVSVPNEKGPVFLAKWLAKRMLTRDKNKYSAADVFNHTLNRIHRVTHARSHKGFDYAKLARQMERYFKIERIEGIPFGPACLSFGVGIVARSH